MVKDLFKNWKLRLRFGKLKTHLKGFVTIVECSGPHSNLFLTVQTWAEDPDQAIEIAIAEAKRRGYQPFKAQLYDKDLDFPPRNNPGIVGEVTEHHYNQQDASTEE